MALDSRTKLLLGLGGSLLVLCGIGSWALWEESGIPDNLREAEKRYAKIEQLGTPLDADAFAASIAVPAAENNAPGLTKSLEAFERTWLTMRPPFSEPDAPSSPNIWSDGAWKTLEAQDRALSAALRDVLSHSNRGRFVIERDWGYPVVHTYPEFGRLRAVCRALGARAALLARQQRRQEAAACLSNMFHLASLPADTPLILGWVTHRSLVAIGTRATANCIQLDPVGVGAYFQEANSAVYRPLGSALRGELYTGIATLRNMNSPRDIESETLEPPKNVRRRDLPDHLLLRLSASRMMEMWLPIMEELDPDGNPKDPARFEVILDETDRKANKMHPLDPVSGFLMPFVGGSVIVSKRTTNLRALLDSYAKIVRYHNRTKSWPQTLDQLGIKTQDAFSATREPFRYRRDATGFRIWSIGRNGTDEGGLSSSEWRRLHPSRASSTAAEDKRESGDDVFIFVAG